jgi:hypothetical protein
LFSFLSCLPSFLLLSHVWYSLTLSRSARLIRLAWRIACCNVPTLELRARLRKTSYDRPVLLHAGRVFLHPVSWKLAINCWKKVKIHQAV